MKDAEVKKELSRLYEEKKYKAMIQMLESLEPRTFRKVWVEFVNEQYEHHNIDVYDVLIDDLSKDEWEKLKWLDSSEREKEYLINRAKKQELTEQEISDLKSCDF